MSEITVRDVYRAIDAFAPFDTQADFDHSGLLVGDMDAPCTGVLVAVDMSRAVLAEAVAAGCNVIVTHHPLVWSPLSSVTESDYVGGLVAAMIRAGIHYIAAHTSVDMAAGGNCHRLIRALGGEVTGTLPEADHVFTFRLPRVTAAELTDRVRAVLPDPLAYRVGADGYVTEGALCTGSGGDEDVVDACIRRGLLYLTAEVKHHLLRMVEDRGGRMIVFGHFASERIFTDSLREHLAPVPVPIVVSAQGDPRIPRP